MLFLMSILILRHEPFEHAGWFAAVLDQYGIPSIYSDLGAPLSFGDHAGVMIMGGPQSANDPIPGLHAELKLIGEAVARKIPILGICLGAQLIAKALGGRVYRNPEREIGWAPVYLTEVAKDDPLFCDVPSPTTFFHWHGETFDLPPGAEWLAYSEKCRHQAFRYGGNVYGLQFHPEITADMIVDWCGQPANCGDVASLDAPIDPHAADSTPFARRILDRWLALA